jgi:hypothetical protein
MTNQEMEVLLKEGGISAEDVEKISGKFNAEKITEIVEATNSPKEAFEALHAFYPELEVEKLQAQMDFVQEQISATVEAQNKKSVELTEAELDNVAGGGFFGDVGNWFKKNWKAVAVGAAIVVGAALVCTGIGAGAGAAITYFTGSSIIKAAGIGLITPTLTSLAHAACIPILTGTGAAIGAAVGTAIGGATTGALAATGNLPN